MNYIHYYIHNFVILFIIKSIEMLYIKAIEKSNHFRTMKENKNRVKALNKNGKIKNPKLDETCVFYGIDFDDTKYHSATYDVSKTFEILRKMNNE